jgi:transcriptional regulator with XRE-family HTH domain
VKELTERLSEKFEDVEARYVYADTVTNALVSAQIKALREDRKLSQTELAELIGTQQSGISRLLRSDYSAWQVETLRKLARAFGVRLHISFEEFGTLVDDVAAFTKKNLLPRKFEDDPVFHPSATKPKPQRSETVPPIPAMPKGNIGLQEPPDPLEEIAQHKDNLTVMRPKSGGELGGMPPIPAQGEVVQAQSK